MKLNERSLAFYATCDTPADNEGFLYKKGGRHAAYHRRWFVLRGNMLFYFEDAASREPVGVIILEGCTVELVEAAEEFAFAVRFAGARARTYVLAAESQAAMEGWVKALSRASFDYLRLVVRELERQLRRLARGAGAAPALPPKENGCASGRSPRGRCPAGATPGSRPGPEPAAAAPRRASAPNGPLDSASFAQLHEWYGQEVRALRSQWLKSQAQPEGGGEA
ncbi:Sesquipedalian-1 [Camelus dromedarius]|uniref:Sesquipedalian n=1 Tax=Camelus dromedarius TaxID=9838 RepID=A0A5N4C9K4_CAMDR|nr:sesquipedalian-1 isoform X2 [Camelus dromedarius]XP_031298583.1 sesquipedalian-1 isoform X2 [Camelus dromedarius]XP_031298584.1 sesquipedalian-1 isoform X2 [Camelus dromedarius]XP_031298585.1 sesquipedalian-1 isoform X2 [Camelus dromedarius]XP_031298586.1 sesquipedalian-1 isoform X2 [Camelus dromedarius]KAB1255547.1 Sesquipedalian-1 [Camelus dromedarius]